MRTGPTRIARILGLLSALALVAAACGGDSADGSTTTATAASATEESTVPDENSTTQADTTDDLAGEFAEAQATLRDDVAQATAPWTTDWTNATIDLGELQLGIPRVDPRDVIAPIDQPTYQSIADAGEWLAPNEPGALVQVDGEARFFPLSIMHRHEIVNDTIGDVPVAVTYCPLCNTAIAFDRRIEGETIRLGVSGLLRNSDMVMWDDSTLSLWQQITGEGIVGARAGAQLTLLSTAIVSFEQFSQNFPDGQSLDPASGFGQTAYGLNPYEGYTSSVTPFLFDGDIDPRFPALDRVIGVSLNGEDKAFPFATLSAEQVVNDVVGDTPIAVLWGGDTVDALDQAIVADSNAVGTGVAYLSEVDGQVLTFSGAGGSEFTDAETGSTWTITGRATAGPLEGTQLETATHRNEFWFAWAAFFPDAAVYEA